MAVNYVDLRPGVGELQSECVRQFAGRVKEKVDMLKTRFGFQAASAENQLENVTILLANIWGQQRGGADANFEGNANTAVRELHQRTFGSYQNWLKMVQEDASGNGFGVCITMGTAVILLLRCCCCC